MDDIASVNRTTNADSMALIVQGTLIFLSAVVAVVGYFVQGQLRKKERRLQSEVEHKDYLRRAKLDLLREKLKTFVGPATMLAMNIWNTMWRNAFSNAMLGGMGAKEDHGAGVPRKNLNILAGGDRVSKHWNNPVEDGGMGFSFFPGMMKGKFNGVTSLVGPAVEADIRADPSSELAKRYFKVCRRIVKQYACQLRDLLNNHGQTLDMRPSTDDFKEAFPVLKGSGWLRNLLYLDFIEWTNEFEEIIQAWDTGDYETLFPTEVDYPLQITRYLSNQLTEIREQETELGTAAHKVLESDSEDDRIKSMEEKHGAKQTSAKGSSPSKKQSSKTSYAVKLERDP